MTSYHYLGNPLHEHVEVIKSGMKDFIFRSLRPHDLCFGRINVCRTDDISKRPFDNPQPSEEIKPSQEEISFGKTMRKYFDHDLVCHTPYFRLNKEHTINVSYRPASYGRYDDYLTIN